jgi:hypothetical protein
MSSQQDVWTERNTKQHDSTFSASLAQVWLVSASVMSGLPAGLNIMVVTAINCGMRSAATYTAQSQHRRNPIANTPTKQKRGTEACTDVYV